MSFVNIETEYINWKTVPSGFINKYPNLSIPYTAFNYFVVSDFSGLIWVKSDSINGSPSTPVTLGQDFGTLNFDIDVSQLGVYRFAIGFLGYTDQGIINFICDGVTTTIDLYNSMYTFTNFQWEQTFTTAGQKTIQLINNGKNVSSSDYNITFRNNFLQIYRTS